MLATSPLFNTNQLRERHNLFCILTRNAIWTIMILELGWHTVLTMERRRMFCATVFLPLSAKDVPLSLSRLACNSSRCKANFPFYRKPNSCKRNDLHASNWVAAWRVSCDYRLRKSKFLKMFQRSGSPISNFRNIFSLCQGVRIVVNVWLACRMRRQEGRLPSLKFPLSKTAFPNPIVRVDKWP